MTSTQAVWAERVRAWRESGESAAKFTEGKGYSKSGLWHWAAKLGRESGCAGPGIAMARVVVKKEEGVRNESLVVEVCGARVVLHKGFSRPLLREVVEALGGAR